MLVQVKNGPLDFQPREPFSPLFGAMPHTNLMPEMQLTKEYLGQATHLVYVGALINEFLHTDTFVHGPGSTIAKVTEDQKLTASPASPIPAATATGADPASTRPTGMRSAGSPGIPRPRRAPSPPTGPR